MIPTLPTYHQTLGAALVALSEHFAAREIITSENWQDAFQFGGIAYGQNKESHFAVDTVKGKKTKKYGHVTIWRSESGVYEVNFYLL